MATSPFLCYLRDADKACNESRPHFVNSVFFLPSLHVTLTLVIRVLTCYWLLRSGHFLERKWSDQMTNKLDDDRKPREVIFRDLRLGCVRRGVHRFVLQPLTAGFLDVPSKPSDTFYFALSCTISLFTSYFSARITCSCKVCHSPRNVYSKRRSW